MGKEFFLVALKIRQEKSKAQLEHDIETFTDSLNALTNGDASRGIIAAPDKARCTAAAMIMPPLAFSQFPPNIVLDAGCQNVRMWQLPWKPPTSFGRRYHP